MQSSSTILPFAHLREDRVNSYSMLVTPEGKWLSEGSDEFLAAVGEPDPDPGYDVALFAVKNLGFVRFSCVQGAIVEIELHPHNVELPALLAVQQQILSSRVNLFRTKYLDTEWHSEITSSREQAVSRLTELCARTFEPPPHERFSCELRDHTALFDNEQNPLRLMLQRWRSSFGKFDSTVVSFAMKHQLISRMMIVGAKPKSPDPVFRFIGEGFFWTDDQYQMRAIGERTVNQPDQDYGAWVTEFYKSVASTGLPRYDCVAATINKPQVGNRVATRYERLLLPWKTNSDEVLVTLSSRTLSRDDSPAGSAWSKPDISSARKSAKSS
jgi:hypothetical protein